MPFEPKPSPEIIESGAGWRLAPDPERDEQLRELWSMTPTQRVHAMRAGRLSRHQLFAWVARHPKECPTVNGEWEFIAATLADLDGN